MKLTGDTIPDEVEGPTHIDEPAVEPEADFAAFAGTATSTSIAMSALRFDLRAGEAESTGATAGVVSTAVTTGGLGGVPDAHVTRTW